MFVDNVLTVSCSGYHYTVECPCLTCCCHDMCVWFSHQDQCVGGDGGSGDGASVGERSSVGDRVHYLQYTNEQTTVIFLYCLLQSFSSGFPHSSPSSFLLLLLFPPNKRQHVAPFAREDNICKTISASAHRCLLSIIILFIFHPTAYLSYSCLFFFYIGIPPSRAISEGLLCQKEVKKMR